MIEKTFSEERNWEPDRGELFPWLKWVIKSEVSHLAESSSNKKDVHLDQLDDGDPILDRIEYEASRQSRVRPQDKSPEEAMIAMEAEEELRSTANSKINLLLEACNGKPELEAIVYAISEGNCLPKAQSLAKYLGKPVEEIYQQLRTLRRRANKIRIEAENGRE